MTVCTLPARYGAMPPRALFGEHTDILLQFYCAGTINVGVKHVIQLECWLRCRWCVILTIGSAITMHGMTAPFHLRSWAQTKKSDAGACTAAKFWAI